MKKSKFVEITLLTAAALTFTACNDRRVQVQTCVDRNNVVVNERLCEESDRYKRAFQNQPPSPIPPWWYYHWLFGGRSSMGYRPGAIITGGALRPAQGLSAVRGSYVESDGLVVESGGVVRGGFGSSAHSDGGGE